MSKTLNLKFAAGDKCFVIFNNQIKETEIRGVTYSGSMEERRDVGTGAIIRTPVESVKYSTYLEPNKGLLPNQVFETSQDAIKSLTSGLEKVSAPGGQQTDAKAEDGSKEKVN